MITINGTNSHTTTRAHAPTALAIAALALLLAAPGASEARDRFCSDTARAQYVACQNEAKDDRLTLKAICINTEDDEERAECLDEFKESRTDGNEECREQRDARRDLCDLLGEDRYNPDFDPDDFDTDFVNPPNLNPYLPVKIGNFWAYEGGGETNTVEMLPKTKLIEDVTCLVSRDLVKVGGVDLEDTDDWFGQRKDGAVVYCGEEVKDFATFAGDNPVERELVEIEGSFKVGRDGDRHGTLMPGTPEVGRTYRQEWSPGNAEDAATILSTTYSFGDDPELDAFVPQALADHLCDHDCIVTFDFSPLEPEAREHKFYALGIGVFLEVDLTNGEINRLVGCNVGPKCATLPPAP